MTGEVLFVGAATYDAIAVVQRLPSPDERVIADDITYAGGGPAATAAVAAKRLGIPVGVIASVGEDTAGSFIREGLAAAGIRTDLLQISHGRPSQASVVLCSTNDAARSIVTRGVAPLQLTAENRERVRAAEWVHVDHLGWPAVAQALADVPLERRPRISVDAGNPLVGDASACRIAEVELYVPPLERLVDVYGDLPLGRILAAVPSRMVVATLGAEGSCGRDEIGRVHTAPGVVVDGFGSTLGAGDVFHGALTAAAVRGLPMPDALTYANAVAGLSCRGVDGRSAIPDHDETLASIQKEPA